MPVSRDQLVSELRELVRLTAFEQAVTTVRRTQAATPEVGQELAENARKAGERLALLRNAVREVGGVPDVVTALVGRTGALLQAQVNQVQTLQGALLGDLALEHQLRERARYARTIATSLGEHSVLPVLDRLESAHSETIDWLEARLAEVGRTGTSAIRATPVQVAVGAVRRVATAPFVVTANGINQVAGLLGRFGRRAPATAGDAAQPAAQPAAQTAAQAAGAAAGAAATVAEQTSGVVEQIASTAGDVAEQVAGTTADAVGTVAQTAGDVAQQVAGTTADAAGTVAQTAQQVAATTADAAGTVAQTAQQVAGTTADAAGTVAQTAGDTASAAEDDQPSKEEEAAAAAEATHEVLEQTGGGDVEDDKPPFAGYARLTGDSIMRHVNDTDDVEELRTLLAYEQAHKARKGVLAAAQARLTALAPAQ